MRVKTGVGRRSMWQEWDEKKGGIGCIRGEGREGKEGGKSHRPSQKPQLPLVFRPSRR